MQVAVYNTVANNSIKAFQCIKLFMAYFSLHVTVVCCKCDILLCVGYVVYSNTFIYILLSYSTLLLPTNRDHTDQDIAIIIIIIIIITDNNNFPQLPCKLSSTFHDLDTTVDIPAEYMLST